MIGLIIKFIKKLLLYSRKPMAIKIDEPKIVLVPSPNFSARKDNKIDCIVIHHTGTHSAKRDIEWLTTKYYKDKQGNSIRNYASAHYVIDRSGVIFSLVKDKDKAWHAGRSYYDGKFDVNQFSIGIELVGDGNIDTFTNKQYDSLIWLCNSLINKHNISRDKITSHSYIRTQFKIRKPKVSVALKYDPGKNFDWERLLRDLDG